MILNSSFIKQQQQSLEHKLAIYFTPLVVLIGYTNPYIFLTGLFIFFLLTSFKLLKTMILWMILLGTVSILIPFLAPIIFIVMVILFIMRIGFVKNNWKPFLSGICFYGYMGLLIYRSQQYYEDGVWSLTLLTEAVMMSFISLILIRIILLKLYKNGYECYQALGIMGSAPLIIISFILPFLKIHIGGDIFVGETTATEGNTSFTNETTVVREHIRTAPDGDVRNNLSYTGPDKTAPNNQLVEVKSHIRTLPNETITENLSHQNVTSTSESSVGSERTSRLSAPIAATTGSRYKSRYSEGTPFVEKMKKYKISVSIIILLLFGFSGWVLSDVFLSNKKNTQSQTQTNLQNDAFHQDQLLGNSVPSQTIEPTGNTEPILDEEIETTNTIEDKIYRLQVGAYAQEENARKLADELNHKGFSAFVKHEDPYYKVQAGAFSIKENAEEIKKLLEEDGYIVYLTEE